MNFNLEIDEWMIIKLYVLHVLFVYQTSLIIIEDGCHCTDSRRQMYPKIYSFKEYMAVVHGCLPDRQLNGSLHDQYTGPGILTQIQTADMNATNRSLKYVRQ